MGNSRAKGRRTYNKVKDYLEKDGWITEETELTGKFRKYKDAFSGFCLSCWKRDDKCCKNQNQFEGFDMIALKVLPDKLPVVKFVQIKSNQPVTQKNYKIFASKFASKNIEIECWTWYDRRGFVIHKFLSNGKVKKVDLRK